MGLWLNFWYYSLWTLPDRWTMEEVSGGLQAAWRCQNQIGSSNGSNEWFHLSRCCLRLHHVYLISWEPCKCFLLSDLSIFLVLDLWSIFHVPNTMYYVLTPLSRKIYWTLGAHFLWDIPHVNNIFFVIKFLIFGFDQTYGPYSFSFWIFKHLFYNLKTEL